MRHDVREEQVKPLIHTLRLERLAQLARRLEQELSNINLPRHTPPASTA
jgi:hypothetical protein